jgi:hypothetical protein
MLVFVRFHKEVFELGNGFVTLIRAAIVPHNAPVVRSQSLTPSVLLDVRTWLSGEKASVLVKSELSSKVTHFLPQFSRTTGRRVIHGGTV